MQHILSESEYNRLVPKKELEDARVALKLLKEQIIKLSGCEYRCQKYDPMIRYCTDCPCDMEIKSYHVRQFCCSEGRDYPK